MNIKKANHLRIPKIGVQYSLANILERKMRFTVEITSASDKSVIPTHVSGCTKIQIENGSYNIGPNSIDFTANGDTFSLCTNAVLIIRDYDGRTLWVNPRYDEMERREILADVFAR